jgi:hypothetical protein
MAQWASVVGLTLTAIGVLIAFYLPRLGSYWGWSDAAERRQFWLRVRTATGAALVIIGTFLQIYAAWPH